MSENERITNESKQMNYITAAIIAFEIILIIETITRSLI